MMTTLARAIRGTTDEVVNNTFGMRWFVVISAAGGLAIGVTLGSIAGEITGGWLVHNYPLR